MRVKGNAADYFSNQPAVVELLRDGIEDTLLRSAPPLLLEWCHQVYLLSRGLKGKKEERPKHIGITDVQ